MKLASVVIPSYNHAAYLPQAIESVLAQSYDNLELIVIDDGSTDSSREYLRGLTDPRCTIIEQPNGGAHAAINRGLSIAKGEFIAILNSDDVFHRERLAACAEELVRGPFDLAASWLEVIDTSGAVLGVKEGWQNMLPWPTKTSAEAFARLDAFYSNLLLSNFVSTTSNVVFTRRLFEQIGGMRNLRFAHDWDFLLRAADSFRCSLIERPLLQYRIHPSNTISTNREWMLFEICWIFATAFRRLEGRALFRDGTIEALARDANLLGGAVNPQGNGKVLWMIDRFISARLDAGDIYPEERLLDDPKLRDAFLRHVIA